MAGDRARAVAPGTSFADEAHSTQIRKTRVPAVCRNRRTKAECHKRRAKSELVCPAAAYEHSSLRQTLCIVCCRDAHQALALLRQSERGTRISCLLLCDGSIEYRLPAEAMTCITARLQHIKSRCGGTHPQLGHRARNSGAWGKAAGTAGPTRVMNFHLCDARAEQAESAEELRHHTARRQEWLGCEAKYRLSFHYICAAAQDW